MKRIFVFAIAFFLISKSFAQQHSCDIAYRFDAAFTTAFDQLDQVSILLYQTKPTAEKVSNPKAGGSYYYVSGTTSSKSFQAVEANIGFKKCFVLQPNIELYKAEVKNGMRTFTIPAGTNGSLSVNIPIQVVTPPGTKTNGQINWGPGNFKIKFSNGYLTPGEYILIDKESISADGSQMKGYAFTIK